jgi:diguanylate cyclase (GGDEF)-like protein/PAS domain S-box-containing protein
MNQMLNQPSDFRILVADGEAENRLKLRFVLEREGYTVAEAGNGEEVLSQFLSFKPQLILLEAILPGLNGYEVCGQIKKEIETGETMVIMISILEDDKSIELAFAAGAIDFFPKPFNWPLLRERIKKIRSNFLIQNNPQLCQQLDAVKRASEQRLADIINFLPDATFVVDREGKVITWNKAIEVLTGVPAQKMLGKGKYEYAIPFYGKRRPMLVDLLLKTNEEAEKNYAFLQKEENWVIGETLLPSLQGKQVTVWAKASRLYDQDGNVYGAIESIRDITQNKRTDQHLAQISLRDSLTNLYNRAYFLEELNRYEHQKFTPLGIIMITVDGLRFVNDTVGYDAGDVLLLAATNVIKKCFNEEDIVARVGGNEFAILFPSNSRSDLERLRRRINETVDSYNQAGHKLLLSFSIGLTFRSSASKSMLTLFQEAENSMSYEKIQKAEKVRNLIVKKLSQALESLYFMAEGHGDRVKRLTGRMASALRLPEGSVNELQLLAQYHDLGKVGVPEGIILKRGLLSPEERVIVQKHSEIGHRLALAAPDLVPIADYILKHHEWWNGEGYPLGLKGEEIPLACRILAIADAYDAMTNSRPFREPKSSAQALQELKKYAGTQFDPQLVDVFLEIIGTGNNS